MPSHAQMAAAATTAPLPLREPQAAAPSPHPDIDTDESRMAQRAAYLAAAIRAREKPMRRASCAPDMPSALRTVRSQPSEGVRRPAVWVAARSTIV